MDTRAALGAIGSSMAIALAACSVLGDPEANRFHLELIDASEGEVPFTSSSNGRTRLYFGNRSRSKTGPILPRPVGRRSRLFESGPASTIYWRRSDATWLAVRSPHPRRGAILSRLGGAGSRADGTGRSIAGAVNKGQAPDVALEGTTPDVILADAVVVWVAE